MIISRLLLLIVFFGISIGDAAPVNIPVLKWHRAHFHNVDTALRFTKNQKVVISCETGSSGTVVEVSERCFNSCEDDCKPDHGKKRKEFFTCNQAIVGPITLRTFTPNPNGLAFNVNKTHFFTSLENVTREGRLTTLCKDGMKFKVIVSNEVDDEMHRTTMEHPLFSNSHFYHTHPASTSTEHTIKTTVKPVEMITVTRAVERRENPREEPIQAPMLTDKSGTPEEILDRFTSEPPTPYTLRELRHDSNKLRYFKFDRIGNTVMYNENGEMDQFYEVALPLGIDPNHSSTRFSFLSMATLLFLLAILL